MRRLIFTIDSVISNNRYNLQCVAVCEENQGNLHFNNSSLYIAKGKLDDLKMCGSCFGDPGCDLELTACFHFPGF